jgi:RNA polymerase sigma factor (sigma-70 family)
MANPMSDVMSHLQSIALRPNGAGLSDGELLDVFIARRNGACFEALVRRHGPMVLGVCRRILGNPHDAEDAFQATFLVLAQRAASVVPREAVGNWLYGVAYRTALQARRAAARRKKRETQVKEIPDSGVIEDPSWHSLLPVLDRELERLPAKYRTAVVLCHLDGKTRNEAARHLGVPVGTLSGRLTTAMRRLAKSLSRYGLALSGGTLAALLAPATASAVVPGSLRASAAQAGTLAALGQAAAAGFVPARVTALSNGVMKSMLLTKLKTYLAVLLAVALSATGGGWLAGRTLTVPQQQARHQGQSLAGAPPIERVLSDEAKFQGAWVALSGEENGQQVSARGLQSWGHLAFAGGKVIRAGGERREGTYTINPDKDPKEIDLFTEENTWRAIYRFEGNRLKLVLRFGEKRPTEFASREALLLLYAPESESRPGAGSP